MAKYFNVGSIEKAAYRKSVIDVMRRSMNIIRGSQKVKEPVTAVVKGTSTAVTTTKRKRDYTKAKQVAKAFGLVGGGALIGAGLDSD